jgi:multidrug transporter EmrE-like cation transporter
MRSAILLFGFLAFAVCGQLTVKMRAIVHATAPRQSGQLDYLFLMFTDWRVLAALAATFLGGVCWLLAIQRLEIGYAYPFVGLTFVIVPVSSAILFGEPLPPLRLFGLLLIAAGIAMSAFAK